MRLAYLLRRLAPLMTLIFLASMAAEALAQQQVPRPKRTGTQYRVRIDSAPQQAAIYLDDKRYGIVGYTPWEGRLQRGDWNVIIEKDGYETAQRTIRVERMRTTQETFIPLVKKEDPAQLDVRADADKNAFGAQVWLNGQLQGQIPLVLKVGDGRHLIEIKKDEFEDFTQWVEAKEGDRITVNPMLRPRQQVKTGSILVEADVSGAEVYLDGNKHPDLTPTIITDVSAGPHVVEVRKEPAMPWRQTVNVVADQTVKVSAQLQATIGGPGGTVRVLANVDGARVFLDGTDLGEAPIDIKDIRPGPHVIEVKAPGYISGEKRVTVSAGSSEVLKFDLMPAASGAVGTLKVVSPVPEAVVFIDGENVGQVPQTREVSAGEHFVVVQQKGYKTFEQKIRIEPGQTMTVTAELKAIGALQVLSNPAGAQVYINGELIGPTPLRLDDLDAGEHVVKIQYANYYDFEKRISVQGGEREIVSATLEAIDTGPTSEQLQREQRGLTSFGARTLPKGRSTIDAAVGYPYYMDGSITVGAGKMANFGFDAGVMFRSFFSRSELGVRARLMLADVDPFSFGVFGNLGGGSNFFDDSARNTFFMHLGAAASLTAVGNVTVSGRAYLDIWSDRHCPSLVDDGMGNQVFDGKPSSTCQGYFALENGGDPGDFTVEDRMRVDSLLGSSSIFGREGGVRGMLQVAVEVAAYQRWNVFVLFEGAPFQSERAAYTNPFNGAMFNSDLGTYFRVGSTYKF
jgi:hypothetical protein